MKAVVEIYSPVSGKIFEVNMKLEENPELLNSSNCLENGNLFLKNILLIILKLLFVFGIIYNRHFLVFY